MASNQRLSGPGTRRKNPQLYDDFGRGAGMRTIKPTGKGSFLARQLKKLQARRADMILTHTGPRRADPAAYHMPGSMTK